MKFEGIEYRKKMFPFVVRGEMALGCACVAVLLWNKQTMLWNRIMFFFFVYNQAIFNGNNVKMLQFSAFCRLRLLALFQFWYEYLLWLRNTMRVFSFQWCWHIKNVSNVEFLWHWKEFSFFFYFSQQNRFSDNSILYKCMRCKYLIQWHFFLLLLFGKENTKRFRRVEQVKYKSTRKIR